MTLELSVRPSRRPVALAVAGLLALCTLGALAQMPPAVGPGGPGGPSDATAVQPGDPPLPPGMPPMPPQEPVVFVPAVEIVDGQWRAGDPAAQARVQGQGRTHGLQVTTTRDRINALIVRGQGATTLQADRCTIVVRRSGYGTYADNGTAVTINDSRMDVPTFGGVFAGQASLSLNRVVSRSGGNTVMIHSVMGQPQEVGTLRIDGGTLHSTNAAIVVKSANADIVIRRATLRADNGDLLLGVVNDDGFATKTQGRPVPGIRALVQGSTLAGNLVHLDGKDRAMHVRLEGSTLRVRVQDVHLTLADGSRWTATADSTVRLDTAPAEGHIDALPGVTITALASPGTLAAGERRLPGGGTLRVQAPPPAPAAPASPL